MDLYKKPAYSYENTYNRLHYAKLYGEELPENVGEWVEQTVDRWYDQAAAFFDSAISSIANGISSTSQMANGDEIKHTISLSTPTNVTSNGSTISTTNDSVIITHNISTPNYNGFGASYTIRQAVATDTTSTDGN